MPLKMPFSGLKRGKKPSRKTAGDFHFRLQRPENLAATFEAEKMSEVALEGAKMLFKKIPKSRRQLKICQ